MATKEEDCGNQRADTWRMSTKSKKYDLTEAKRWCGVEAPSLWSHANAAGLESDPTRKFTLIHKVSDYVCQIFVLFPHRLYFHAYGFPDKRSHCDKVLFKSSQMSRGLTHKASSAQVL